MKKPELRQSLAMHQKQKMIPKMMLAGEMMMLPLEELEMKLEQLLQENPFLEFEERMFCFACEQPLDRYLDFCPNCGRIVRNDTGYYLEDPGSFSEKRSFKELLEEEILSCVELNKEELKLLEVILANLDEEGFLRLDLRKLAFHLGVPEDRLQGVIEKVRAEGFVGFAAADTLEFVLLQCLNKGLITLEESFQLRKNPEQIRFLLKKGESLFVSFREFFEAGLDERSRKELDDTRRIAYDAEIVALGGGEYGVLLFDSPYLKLTLNEGFISLFKDKRSSLNSREQSFLEERLREAREVLSCLRYRNSLLLRALEYIVFREKKYLAGDNTAFVPLLQKEVAEALGVSIAAVCQVLKDKRVLLPSGVVKEVKFFFDPSYPAKQVIKQLIQREDHKKPLSDASIAAYLRKLGFSVSRRTVTLYRDQLGILPSHSRKKLYASMTS